MTVAAGPGQTTLDAAVLDSSVLMCILMAEPAAPLFITALQNTTHLYISAATRCEAWLAAFNAKGAAGAKQVEALLAALQVQTIDLSQDSFTLFTDGAQRHHHRVDNKARLNFGDLFTFALAKKMALPLFFQGTDFAHTDIQNAMVLLGYDWSEQGVPLAINK